MITGEDSVTVARPSTWREQLIGRRHQLGLTQAELAERLGIDQTGVSRLESGAHPDTRIQTIERWSAALGMRVGVEPDDDAPAP